MIVDYTNTNGVSRVQSDVVQGGRMDGLLRLSRAISEAEWSSKCLFWLDLVYFPWFCTRNAMKCLGFAPFRALNGRRSAPLNCRPLRQGGRTAEIPARSSGPPAV